MTARQHAKPVFETPCAAPLDQMPAFDRGRRRFCSECSRSVHMLSERTRDEAQAFLRENAGKACISYRRGPDGRVQFRAPEPALVPVTKVRRRPRPRAAAAPVIGVLCACAPHVSVEQEQLDETPSELERDLEQRFGTDTQRMQLPDARPEPPPAFEIIDELPTSSDEAILGVIGEFGSPGTYAGGMSHEPLQFAEPVGASRPHAVSGNSMDEP